MSMLRPGKYIRFAAIKLANKHFESAMMATLNDQPVAASFGGYGLAVQ